MSEAAHPYRYVPQPEGAFDFERLYDLPPQLARAQDDGPRKRVAIIGAGIAGLVAAYELKQRGHEPIVLESSARTGGRILTHRFPHGVHGEFGAMRIPANHRGTLHYIEKMGLKLRRFVNHNPNAYYHLRGHRARLGDWADIAAKFRLAPGENAPPHVLLESLMVQAMSRLSSSDKWRIFSSIAGSTQLEAYDAITLWQHLRDVLSQEAIEYVGHATGMLQYERASFLETLVDYFGLFRVDQYELVDGMQALTDGLARDLAGHLHLHAEVNAIDCSPTGAWVTWKGFGGLQRLHADYVICTAPAPALGRVRFSPELPYAKSQALRIKYASAAKTLVLCRKRVWELEDGIFGGGSFTDLPIQQCWYPSDNAQPLAQAVQLEARTGSDTHATSAAPLHWAGRSTERSHEVGVFTASYTWESNADRMVALTEAQRTDLVLSNLRRVHPGIEEHLLDVAHFSWNQQTSPGCGAFAYFAPGEHLRYQSALCTPFPAAAPRVFFAGEHLSVAHAWIQGAISTAWTAVIDVLNAPAPSSSAPERPANLFAI